MKQNYLYLKKNAMTATKAVVASNISVILSSMATDVSPFLPPYLFCNSSPFTPVLIVGKQLTTLPCVSQTHVIVMP